MRKWTVSHLAMHRFRSKIGRGLPNPHEYFRRIGRRLSNTRNYPRTGRGL